MGRNRKKPLPIFENVSIIDTNAEGFGVGKTQEQVVFVKHAVPGDIVDVQITKKRSKYKLGVIVNTHHSSDKRTNAVCEHFGTCGGCKWQNMQYKWQLHYKQKHVVDTLERIAKIKLPEISNIIGSEKTYHYRNKLEYTFSSKKWLTTEEINNTELVFGDGEGEYSRKGLGFHIPGAFDKVLDINKCHLQEAPSNNIRLAIKKYALRNGLSFFDLREQVGLLRNIIIRSTSTNEWMLILVVHYNDQDAIEALLNHISEEFPQLTSIQYVVNSKRNDTIGDLDINVFKGNDSIYEQMEGLRFKIGPKSFYQTNPTQAYALYKIAREYAQIKKEDIVYDLYTGTGTIANFVAHKAQKVVGVEYVPEAIIDAQINAQNNNINNVNFFAGDMKDILTTSFIKEHGKPNVIITDPPRAGMHEDVTKKILEMEAQKVVYISCNPSTQARDIQLLDEKYNVTKVQPVDMFPQTHHVENVVLLELK